MKIRTRMELTMGSLIVAVALGIAASLFFSQKTLIRRSIDKDEERIVSSFAAVSRQYMLTKNDLLLANYLAVMIRMDGVEYAFLAAPSGRILGHTDSQFLFKPLSAWLDASRGRPPATERRAEVRFGGKDAASVVVGFSRAYMQGVVDAGVRTLMRRILVGMIVCLLPGLIAAYFLAGHLTGPIVELAKGAAEIGRGNFAVKVPVHSDDELGVLTGSFNEMGRQLAQLDQMKDDFIANVSHDLRSPLAAIIMSGEIIVNSKEGELSTQQSDMLEIIVSSAKRLSAFINNILDAAKIKAGRMEYALKSHDLPVLIRDVSKVLESLAKSKNIALAFDAPPNFPPVRADGEKIQQVVTNLLSNAIKYTPQGGKIRVSATVDGTFARVAIADTGRGIPPADLPKLFQKFVQLKSGEATGVQVQSTGLGLSIVREMVEGQGGKVGVDSTVGAGSTFHFTVPLASS